MTAELRIIFETRDAEPCLSDAEKAQLMSGVTEFLPDRIMDGFRLRSVEIER